MYKINPHIILCLITAASAFPFFLHSHDDVTILNRTKKAASPSNPETALDFSSPAKERPPPFVHAMWDENGKVCILAKIDASFTITYESSYGKQQMIDRITTDSTTKGRCYSELDEMPVLDIKWRGGFTFRMVFTKSDGVNEWAIYVMELLYNTGDSLFKDAVHVGKTLAKSREGSLRQFTTALDRSYLCPAGTVHTLYSSKGEPNVVLRLFNVQIQPFRVKDARFSTPQHCGQVSFGAGVLYQQDDSVIVIVGSIYILMSIGVVIGYAVYRSYFLQRPDYDTMA